MRRRTTRCLLVLLGLLAGPPPPPAGADDLPAGAVPLPVDRTGTVRADDGPVFYVDGPTVIPRKVELRVERDVVIVGVHDASLDVQGRLEIHGTQDHWVEVKDIDFSPTRAPFHGMHIDMTYLTRCRFQHQEGEPYVGELVIENTTMGRACAFDVRIARGTLQLMTIESGIPWTIRLEPPAGERPDIQAEVRSCWAREIALSGSGAVVLRHSEIRGGLAVENVTDFTLDGCDLQGTVRFRQGPTASYKDVRITKCNFWEGTTLELDREPGEDAKKEKVRIDKCYFGPKEGGEGLRRAGDVAPLVVDGTDHPERMVEARIAGLQESKHELVDYGTLRLRVPALR